MIGTGPATLIEGRIAQTAIRAANPAMRAMSVVLLVRDLLIGALLRLCAG